LIQEVCLFAIELSVQTEGKMCSIRFLLSINAALAALLLAGHATAAPKVRPVDKTAQRAAAASPMKASEIERLYAGRTWKWKAGGGFFSADNSKGWFIPTDWKQFAAWSREHGWSYGEGSWYAPTDGKLCLNAVWTAIDGRARAISCFLIREQDGVIYQKSSIGGKWYVFSHNPARQDDEIQKLVNSDLVSDELARMKSTRR
jgi:hypothetical protein